MEPQFTPAGGQPNAPIAMFDDDEAKEENDALGELSQSGSRGLLLSAGSFYMHQTDWRDVSETTEV